MNEQSHIKIFRKECACLRERERDYEMNRSFDVFDAGGATLVIRRPVPVMPPRELDLRAPGSVSIDDDTVHSQSSCFAPRPTFSNSVALSEYTI